MRRLPRLARCWSLVLLALVASGEPLRAQESQQTPRASGAQDTPRATRGERMRVPMQRQAPSSFERSARELRPAERRALQRRLRRMSPQQRQELFRRWEQMSLHERREAMQQIERDLEGRRARQLPPRLRTAEMRERLEQMTPEERAAFFSRAREWRGMKPAERQRMRARLARFAALSDTEQTALVEREFKRRSPEQREKILRDLRAAAQRLAPPPTEGSPPPQPEAPPALAPAPSGEPPARPPASD